MLRPSRNPSRFTSDDDARPQPEIQLDLIGSVGGKRASWFGTGIKKPRILLRGLLLNGGPVNGTDGVGRSSAGRYCPRRDRTDIGCSNSPHANYRHVRAAAKRGCRR